MHKIKKRVFSVILIIFLTITALVIYIASPHTYYGDLESDYSERYYELLHKNPLTEEERTEFLAEKKKGEAEAFEEYESMFKDK